MNCHRKGSHLGKKDEGGGCGEVHREGGVQEELVNGPPPALLPLLHIQGVRWGGGRGGGSELEWIMEEHSSPPPSTQELLARHSRPSQRRISPTHSGRIAGPALTLPLSSPTSLDPLLYPLSTVCVCASLFPPLPRPSPFSLFHSFCLYNSLFSSPSLSLPKTR
jgi:hypothetical protein